jgi:hypothetical protein
MIKSLAKTLTTSDFLFGQDLDIAYKVISTLLDYEIKQTGLNLTSERDGQFVQVRLFLFKSRFHIQRLYVYFVKIASNYWYIGNVDFLLTSEAYIGGNLIFLS